MNNIKLKASLSYAKAGIPVFPLNNPDEYGKCSCGRSDCHAVGKHPRTINGFNDATTDETRIRGWFNKWPDANIGMPTGVASGIDVLDIDPRSGGDKSLAELEAKNGPLPKTQKVITGGNGLHYYFKHESKFSKSQSNVMPGIDIKTDGGYVVAPLSLHASGKLYLWSPGYGPEEISLASAPQWLVDLEKYLPQKKPNSKSGGPILEGRRNSALTSLAGKMRRKGFDLKEIESVLQEENLRSCRPPLDALEVLQIAESISRYEPAENDDIDRLKSQSQSSTLISLTEDFNFFYTPDKQVFSVVLVNGHQELMNVGSKAFKDLLSMRYYQYTKGAPNTNAVTDALAILRAKALTNSKEEQIHIRVGGTLDRIGLDLGDKNWESVEITSEGWNISSGCNIKFYRSPGMRPLPKPDRGGDVNLLRNYLNIEDKDWILIVSWLVSTFLPVGPFPILILLGEQGCAKSTTAKVLRSLIDPAKPSTRAPSRNEQDLLVSARNGWVISLDNLSGLSAEMADALCRLATGGGLSTRSLYSNDEEFLIEAQRPIILNGISEISSRPDLLNRAIVVSLPVIPDEERKPETEFWKSFEEDKPKILGGLLDTISFGLKNQSSIKPESFPRMADFCLWATACERALGFSPGSFRKAFDANQKNSNLSGIEGSAVAQAVIEFMKGKTHWEDTATELLKELDQLENHFNNDKYWPTQANKLSKELTRVAPLLRTVGINITAGKTGKRHGGTGARLISINKPKEPSQSSQLSQAALVCDDRDDCDDESEVLLPLNGPLKSGGGHG